MAFYIVAYTGVVMKSVSELQPHVHIQCMPTLLDYLGIFRVWNECSGLHNEVTKSPVNVKKTLIIIYIFHKINVT